MEASKKRTPKTPGKQKAKDNTFLFPMEQNLFFRIMASFQEATKLQVRLIPLKKKGIRNPLIRCSHPFCKFIQSSSVGRKRCFQEIKRATKMAAKLGEPYIFQCHANMVEFAAAIYTMGQETYALLCGPMLLRRADQVFEHDTWEKIEDLPLERNLVNQSISEIRVVPERRVQAGADLLFMMANYFAKIDWIFQRPQREITAQQAQWAEDLYLEKFKKGLKKLEPNQLYPGEDFYREKELVELIKKGDRKKAKILLDELLGTLLFRSQEHLGILKARIIEIIVIMARAAVEAGANLEEILGFKYHFFQDIYRDDSQENLYYSLLKAFDHLFACIYQNRNILHTRLFTKAKEFIWSNYNQDISLKKLGEAVGVSPYYLSRLFRRELGISFSDYLKTVRISIAKKLLEESSANVLEVCLEVGYQDPSYFSKVFKEKEGVNPSDYRRKII